MTSILKVSEIQDPTNSNTAISIDAAGNVTAPNLVMPAGSVVQVVRAGWSSHAGTSSTSLVNTGRSATITPTSVNSKVLILLTFGYYASNGGERLYNINIL